MFNKRNIRVAFLLAFISFVPLLLFAEDVTVTFKAGSYQITKNQKNQDVIVMEGFNLGGPAGNPMLPQRIYNIAFPPDINWATLRMRINYVDMETLPDYYNIAPVPPAATWDPETGQRIVVWGDNKKIVAGKNTLVYGSSAFYPENNAELLPNTQMRKWRFSPVQFSPFQYSPASGQLTLIKEMQITLSFERTGAQTEYELQMLVDDVMDDIAQEILYNYQDALKWYQAPGWVPHPAVTYDYVIITSNAIKAASTKLNAFKAHKQSLGYSVKIITETDFAGPHPIAEDIRNWLKNNYIQYQIRYVLLIGNPNPTSSDIPMKMCWPRNNATVYTQYKESPTDHYYADLTANWDGDTDGKYGEMTDDFTSSLQIYPEVFVGRIPVYASAVVPLDSILQKMITYETSIGSYRKKILLPMEPSDGSTPGYQLGEYIKTNVSIPNSDTYYRIYDSTYGLVPPPEKTPCNKTNVVNEWKNGYGMVWWWTHGSATSASDVFDTTLVPQLDNSKPAFTYQCSCLNAHPETTNNLAYELLKYGCVNTVSATRVSWYAVGWTSPISACGDNATIGYYYIYNMRNNGYDSGKGLFLTKASMGLCWTDGASLMNQFDFNIYGDPSMMIGPHRTLDVAAGQGPGAASYVRDFNAQTGSILKTFMAFGAGNVTGEVSVDKGDVTGDGIPEIVVGQRSSSGANSIVRVFSQAGTLLWAFPAFGAGNTSGRVNVGVGDVDKDGTCEIVVGQGPGGNSYVRIFNYGSATPVTTWQAFGAGNVTGEVRVAAGYTAWRVSASKKDSTTYPATIITGVGHGGNSYVRVWDYAIPPTLYKTIKAFGASNTSGGVDVGVGNFYGYDTGTQLIVVGQGGPGATAAGPAGSYIRLFLEDGVLKKTIKAFGAGNTKGRVTVSGGPCDADKPDEIIVGQAIGGQSYFRIFNYNGTLLKTVKAFGASNTNGQIDVAGKQPKQN